MQSGSRYGRLVNTAKGICASCKGSSFEIHLSGSGGVEAICCGCSKTWASFGKRPKRDIGLSETVDRGGVEQGYLVSAKEYNAMTRRRNYQRDYMRKYRVQRDGEGGSK